MRSDLEAVWESFVDPRPDWDPYFLDIADAVSARGDCSRPNGQVGAILVKNNLVCATGYNGAPSGAPGCFSGACPRATSDVPAGSDYNSGPGYCISIHAEANVLLYADRKDTQDGTLYITREPCGGCRKLIKGAGIARVVWRTNPFVYTIMNAEAL